MMDDIEFQKLQEEIDALELQTKEFVEEKVKEAEEPALTAPAPAQPAPVPAPETIAEKPKAKAKAKPKPKAKVEEKVEAKTVEAPAPTPKPSAPLYGAARVKSKLVGYSGK